MTTSSGNWPAQGKRLPLPKVKGGKPANVVVDRSDDQAAYIGKPTTDERGEEHYPEGSLVYRAEHLPKPPPQAGDDNMLKIMSDARKAALDMRLIDPRYPDFPGSKVHRAADRMVEIYRQWAAQRGTQLVFIDLSTPKAARAKEAAAIRALVEKADAGDEWARARLDAMSPDDFDALNSEFSVYDDLRHKLMERGVPAAEIAFVHDANTELQKEDLFAKVRTGRVRFLFGSTAKMGAGTNVQDRLVALHHMDAPWRPSDLEQREGRIIRQGNLLYLADPDGFEVEINRYATKNTLDARMWQTIEAKARFIAQVRKGSLLTRQIEDIGGEAANAAEMKAAASGNPRILEEMDLRQKLRKLDSSRYGHMREQHQVRDNIRYLQRRIAENEAALPKLQADADKVAEMPRDFSLTVGEQTYDKHKDAGAAVIQRLRDIVAANKKDPVSIGSYGPFTLVAEPAMLKNSAWLSVVGARDYGVDIEDVTEADPVGTAMRIVNAVKGLQGAIDGAKAAIENAKKELPAIESQIRPWADEKLFEETQARHDKVLAELRPKPAAAPRAEIAEGSQQNGTTDSGEQSLAARASRRVPVVKLEPEQRANLEKALRAKVRNIFGRDIEVELVPTLSAEGAGDSSYNAAMARFEAAGGSMVDTAGGKIVFHPDGRAIITLATADPAFDAMGSARHEPYHGVEALLMTDEEFAAVTSPENMAKARKAAALELHMDPNGPEIGALPGYEARAIAYERYDRLRDEGRPIHSMGLPAPLARFFEKLRHLLHGVRKYLTGQGYTRLEDIFEDVYQGKMAGRTETYRPLTAGEGEVAGVGNSAVRNANENMGEGFDDIQLDELAVARLKRRLREAQTEAERRRILEETYGVVGGRKIGAALRAMPGVEFIAPGIGPEKGPSTLANRIPRNKEQLVDAVEGMAEDKRAGLYALLPLNYLPDLARPNMKAVGEYLDVKRRMDSYRGERQNRAQDRVDEWRKAALENAPQAKALADLMHAATLAQVDPTRTDDETVAHPAYAGLRQQWNGLSPNMKRLFTEVRDDYLKQTRELDNVILENVRKSMEHAVTEAERAYQKEMQSIRDQGLTGKDREDAEKKADIRRIEITLKGKYANKARLTKLRQSFEANRINGPYFPLGRFGQYFVTVRDVDGSVMDFSRFEKEADRRQFVKEVQQAHPQASVTTGVLSNSTELRNAMDPRIVAEITTILGKANVEMDVMDAIWQRYLATMPDLSIRKRFIHRKGTPGFHEDALRVYGNHMFHAAHQMGRLKYSPDLAELVNVAEEQGKVADDPVRGTKIANELRLRHQWVMNPRNAKWSTAATSFGFVYYLGATPAAAAVNLTQTTIVGVPVIGAKFGVARTVAALGKALADFTRGKGSVVKANLSAAEHEAMQALYDAGALDRSRAHDLAGVAEEELEYSPLRARVMAKIAWLFHNSERLNREVTALAAYRLARRAGETQEQAIKTAGDLTWRTHFDYSNSNRPRVMQGDVARVALLFRNFQINMLYRLMRDVHESFKGESPQARKEARYQLAGVLGMMAFHAGLVGTPFFSWVVIPLWKMIFGDKDDPMSSEDQFRRDVVGALGPQIGGMVLDGVPGYAFGISLTDRIGMPDLWFRGDDRDQTAQDWWDTLGNEMLGPVWNIGTNAIRGWSIVQDGKGLARGIETAAPKPVKDALKAWRYANEGVLNLSGEPVVPHGDMNAWNVLAQLSGFTPAKVAEQYRVNTAKKNMEKAVYAQRRAVLDQYAAARGSGDPADLRAAREAITEFNRVPLHRAVRIDPDTLRRSVATRRRLRDRTEGGILIQNQRLNRELNQAQPERIY